MLFAALFSTLFAGFAAATATAAAVAPAAAPVVGTSDAPFASARDRRLSLTADAAAAGFASLAMLSSLTIVAGCGAGACAICTALAGTA